jgi:superfamily II DNA/RNA helicase
VDLIINLGCPLSVESYLHRAGRAGRFGTYGATVTVLPSLNQYQRLVNLVSEGGLRIRRLPLLAMPNDLIQNQDFFDAAPELGAVVGDLVSGMENVDEEEASKIQQQVKSRRIMRFNKV